MIRIASVVTVLFLLCTVNNAVVAAEAPVQALDIPASLEPWRTWVLHDKGDQQCPAHFDNGTIRRCWWPSRLGIDVGDQGGLFEQQVTVYAPTWVNLPRRPGPLARIGNQRQQSGARGGLQRSTVHLAGARRLPRQRRFRLEHLAGDAPGA